MYENVDIIHYPDPRLKKKCTPVETIDDSIRQLAARMFELMRRDKGVGLAAPQVGVNLRLFVYNHDGEAVNDRVVINPTIEFLEGSVDDEEGCLSIPQIRIKVLRSEKVRLQGLDEHGKSFDLTDAGFIARIWQHEYDHLEGTLLTDRMSMLDKLGWRKRLKLLEAEFDARNTKRKIKL
jgi:peptide deformylase